MSEQIKVRSNKSNRTNTILWTLLLLLVILNYWASECFSDNSTYLFVIILPAVILKFMGVGFQYMELKKSALGWKLLFVSFIVMCTFLLWLAH